jgi:predicted ATPase
VYDTSPLPDVECSFKHALTQEVVYESVPRAVRLERHEQIARVLVDRFPALAETRPELVAHHYAAAGLRERAIPHWRRAGQRAVERAANLEAIDHLSRGLEAIEALPAGRERSLLELDLRTTLGPALMTIKGYGSPEVVHCYARARELCQEVGETPELFAVLRGLWEYYWLRADVATVLALAEELHRLAEQAGDPDLRIVAHDVMGDTSLCLGRFAAARSHLEQGIALHDPGRHRSLAFRHGGYDPGMACRGLGALAIWYLGYPDHALRLSQEALTLCREYPHAPTMVFVLADGGMLHLLRREPHLTLERAEAVRRLSSEHGFSLWMAFGDILGGWARVRLGHGAEAIEQIRRGLEVYRVRAGELERPLWVATLADAYQTLGRRDDGLATVEQALAEIRQTGVRFIEAELHRIRGELLLGQPAGPGAEAERCFQRALEVAREQQARSLELRAALSLGRMLAQRGEGAMARRTLAPVYEWFSEGFQTPDLVDARAFLTGLGAPGAR